MPDQIIIPNENTAQVRRLLDRLEAVARAQVAVAKQLGRFLDRDKAQHMEECLADLRRLLGLQKTERQEPKECSATARNAR